MTASNIALIAAAVVAVSVSLLAWALIDIGVNGLARYRRLFTEHTHVRLRELFLFVDPKRLFLINLAFMLLVGVAAGIASRSWVVAVVMAGIAGAVPRIVLAKLRQRRFDKLEQQLPDALLLLAGGLKAGMGLSQTIAQLVREAQAPVSQEFDLVLREQRLGVGLDEALEGLQQRAPLQSVTLSVSAMRIASETGGQLAETLERASSTLRQKLAMEAKIRALTSQGKLQAWVVGALPILLIVVLNKMEPAAMELMFTTRAGWATLACIGLLEFFGVMIIRKIVDIDV
jgi:tight adherence protein B